MKNSLYVEKFYLTNPNSFKSITNFDNSKIVG